MVAVAPVAIVLGAAAAVGFLFYALWDRLAQLLGRMTATFAQDIERADLKLSNQQLVFGIVGFAVAAWAVFLVAVHADIIRALIALPVFVAITFYGCRNWIRGKVKKRCKTFNDQLEMALRMMSNGLRVGLGLRQAIVLVGEELPDPARFEFMRVVGQTNIGVPMNDALDSLARRVPSDELTMLVDAIKVQSQTGGNLAKILDHLAATIKARRQIARKIKALTGEAKAGAWVIGALPVLVGAFIFSFEPHMRIALLTTSIGHIGISLFFVLEGLGVFVLRQLLAFEV